LQNKWDSYAESSQGEIKPNLPLAQEASLVGSPEPAKASNEFYTLQTDFSQTNGRTASLGDSSPKFDSEFTEHFLTEFTCDVFDQLAGPGSPELDSGTNVTSFEEISDGARESTAGTRNAMCNTPEIVAHKQQTNVKNGAAKLAPILPVPLVDSRCRNDSDRPENQNIPDASQNDLEFFGITEDHEPYSIFWPII
jgi:hypothetical protein